jgi:hypothetical protein
MVSTTVPLVLWNCPVVLSGPLEEDMVESVIDVGVDEKLGVG